MRNIFTASGWTKKGAAYVFALTLTTCLLFGGCDNYNGKLTKSNFDKIHNKMPRKEVKDLLGPGQTVPAQQGEMTGFFGKARQVRMTRACSGRMVSEAFSSLFLTTRSRRGQTEAG